MTRRKPKFKVGQVVRHRIDGAFYARVIDPKATPLYVEEMYGWEGHQTVVLEQGVIRLYRNEQLRPLTKREAGR